jgi:cysteinyl-tRNA synthetase
VDERRWLVLDADAVLGLDLHRVWEAESVAAAAPAGLPADVAALVEARDAARATRDYARADDLRRELTERGWDVVDGPDGSTVRPR